MKGHIRKRTGPHGVSYAVVVYVGKDPRTGRDRYKWSGGHKTKRAAELALPDLLREAQSGALESQAPASMSVADFLRAWLRDHGPTVRPRTAEYYRYIVEQHVVPALGSVPLLKLSPAHVRAFAAAKAAEGTMAARAHRVLSVALNAAVRWEMAPSNVAQRVPPPRRPAPPFRALDEEEVGRLLEAARRSRHYALYHTAVYTGMRRSELLALRWRDVDLEGCEVRVSRGATQIGQEVVFGEPKTSRARRLVDLTPESALTLRGHWERTSDVLRTLGYGPVEGERLVFCHDDGSPLLPLSVSHGFMRLARRLGLEVSFHDLRHTHASMLLKQRAHPKMVSERLGHASVAFTLDRYSHVLPGVQREAIAGFDEALRAKMDLQMPLGRAVTASTPSTSSPGLASATGWHM